MELTEKEARYLIKDIAEWVFWSDDPMFEDALTASGTLAKLIEEYPELADSVREEREMERLQAMEAHKQHMKNKEEEN